jgi:hypothetical protein
MTGPRWTAAQIAENLKYPDGRRAFNTPATVRSWIARHRGRRVEVGPDDVRTFEHVGTTGPRDARLYDSETTVALWIAQHPPAKADATADKTREIERELGVR